MIDIDAIEPVTLEELRARKRRLNAIFWTAHIAPLALPKPQVELPNPVIDIWPEPQDEKPPEPGITPNKIIAEVCRYFGVTRTDFLSARRTQNIVNARQISMYLCKKYTLRSYPEIGCRHGWKDHTTVIHAVSKISALLDTTDPRSELVISINSLSGIITSKYGELDIIELKNHEDKSIGPRRLISPFWWRPDELDMLMKLHSEGKTHREIAAEIGRSQHAIAEKSVQLKLYRNKRR
jgi:hypothetical protein